MMHGWGNNCNPPSSQGCCSGAAMTCVDYTVLIDYVGTGNPIYVGEAVPGSLITTGVWRIKKITYDLSDNPIEIKWAQGLTTFTNKWANRATYVYS